MKFLVFLFIISTWIFAQGLSLDEAFDLIKIQNLEIQAAEYDIQSASLSLVMADA